MKRILKRLVLITILIFGITVPVFAASNNQYEYEFKQKTIAVRVGTSKNIFIYQDGKKADSKSFQWCSSDSEVVEISSKGRVIAKRSGNAQISATNGTKTIICNVYSYVATIYTNFKGYSIKSTNAAIGQSVI